jgi:hypothetical protein
LRGSLRAAAAAAAAGNPESGDVCLRLGWPKWVGGVVTAFKIPINVEIEVALRQAAEKIGRI